MATKRSNEEFLIQVKADIDQATAELRKFTREIENTGKAGSRAAPGISKGVSGMTAMVGAASAYIGLNMISYLVREADAWNQLQARIRTATRDTGDYVQVSQQLFNVSQQNGQQLDTTVALFQSLARTAPELNATNQDMIALTNTVQQLGVISGTSLQQQRAGLLQFTQGLASGVFRAEEFNSIIENLPELANRIARGLGLTVGQLRAAVLEGNILSKDVFDSIQSQAEDIAEQAADIPLSVERAGTRLNNSFTNFLSTLDQAVGGTELLAKGIDGLARSLEKLTPSPAVEDVLSPEQIQQRVKFINEEIVRLEARNDVIRQTADNERKYNDQLALQKNLVEIRVLKQELLDLDEDAISAIERQNQKIFERSEQLRTAFSEYQKMLDEQWSTDDDSAWSDDQRQALDEYKKSMQAFIDTLDPAGKATRELHENLALLNQLFFDDQAISGERYNELVNALLGSAQAAQDATEELDAMDRALDLIEQQFADLDEAEARQIAGLEKFTDAGKDSFDELNAAIRGWGDNFTNTLVDMVTTGELSFKRLADSIIRDLLRIAIQMNITQPLFNAIMPGTFPAPTNHTGGIAGTGSPKRVSPWVFANAPRYHSGGIAGLASNEVPAILQRGEEVLTRDDPRHIANQRSGPVKVVIENKGQPIEAESAEARIDPDGLVISVFTRDLREGGPMSRSLQGTFGLNRK